MRDQLGAEWEHIDIQDSWVRDIKVMPYKLVFVVDFSLCSTHPRYTSPEPGHWTCYKHGTLTFDGFTTLEWADAGRPPTEDPDGTEDYDAFDAMTLGVTQAVIYGDFGTITVTGDDLHVTAEY